MAEEKKQTKRPTAEKRMLQNGKQALLNQSFKSKIKTAIRSFEQAVAAKDASVKDKLNTLFSLFDNAVKKKIYKLNKSARQVSLH